MAHSGLDTCSTECFTALISYIFLSLTRFFLLLFLSLSLTLSIQVEKITVFARFNYKGHMTNREQKNSNSR